MTGSDDEGRRADVWWACYELTPPYTLLYFEANNFNPTLIPGFLVIAASSHNNENNITILQQLWDFNVT